MSIESSDDRLSYMSVFGVEALVSGDSITAIFDNPWIESLEYSTSSPMLTCRTEDVSDYVYGNSVVVPSESFSGTIRDVQPDGVGITILMLAEN